MAQDKTVWLLLDTYGGTSRRRVMVGAYADKEEAEAHQRRMPLCLSLVPVQLGARPARI